MLLVTHLLVALALLASLVAQLLVPELWLLPTLTLLAGTGWLLHRRPQAG